MSFNLVSGFGISSIFGINFTLVVFRYVPSLNILILIQCCSLCIAINSPAGIFISFLFSKSSHFPFISCLCCYCSYIIDRAVFLAVYQSWSQPVIKGVPPLPRDSHSCTTVGDNLYVFGGTDGMRPLKDLHILDTCELLRSFCICTFDLPFISYPYLVTCFYVDLCIGNLIV